MTVEDHKKMKRREHPGGTRFITFSCYKRLPLLGKPPIRDVFTEALVRTRQQFSFELYAWVVMPEHVHLLLGAPPVAPLSRALAALKQSVAQQMINRWQVLNARILNRITHESGKCRFWQPGGGFDRNVRTTDAFRKNVLYIHTNPVKRELVERPEDWEWSSYRWWCGNHDGEIPCDPPPGDPRLWSGWKKFAFNVKPKTTQ